MFHAQGSRVITVVVQVGAAKIYGIVAAVEALRKEERQDKTQFTTKIGVKTSLDPPVLLLCKIFIPSYAFDTIAGHSRPLIARLYR